MRFEALASSSKGNAYIVSDRETRILIECGISHKQLQKLTDFSLAEFKACLVSHEHDDHSHSVAALVKDGIEVFMSQGTAEALGAEAVTLVESMEQFNVGTLDIVPFATFHDAREPLGFLIKSRADGDVLAFATDTVNLRYRFPGLNILAIEANYDKHILERCTKMPEKTRHRISNSHMEIDTLCDYLRGLDLRSCREIHLLHLSDSTSHEGYFINKVTRAVPPWVTVTACKKAR
ncbi:MAG: MBL fold metallo-hydrolase [Bacteroidaceae bacterium]|nr:MBL fold metallo-hydrolase [Bacteroidaceae bacterium]